ncbi:MAG: polysaccharide deacetylase family protein, partial [Bdellovibrionales bacterium]|nr:polysaccharide deacetylase family protein [Bdellovibrionales bacterium]
EVLKRLGVWDKRGHLIANHTFSHPNFHTISVTEFEADILKCEQLIKGFKNFSKLFRFPFLKAGDTKEKRDGIRRFLKTQGYKNGYVTIDASDWYVSSRLEGRLTKNPKADTRPYRDYYLQHMWDRAQYYNELSKRHLQREVDHTLLVHHNLLNSLFLEDLLAMFKAKGWTLIDASVAFQDPVFGIQTEVLPAGESILWSIAKANGDGSLRRPGEDSAYEKEAMDQKQL